MDTALLRGLKDKVRKFIVEENNSYTGIYIDTGEIFCTQLIRDKTGSLKISYAEKIRIAGASDEDIQYGMEELQNSFLKAGISNYNVIVCLAEDKVYYYHKAFPALEKDKLLSAIHWDIASNVPFGEDYLESFYKEEENRYLVGAIDKDYFAELQELFASVDINVNCVVTSAGESITINPEYVMVGNVKCKLPDFLADYFTEEGQLLSLYASVSGFFSQGLEFSLEKKKSFLWNYLHLCACVFLSSFVILTGSIGFSLWQYNNIKAELNEAKQEFLLLSEVWDSKKNTDEISEKYNTKANLLQELKKSSWPVYAIMIHLGCNTEEGTWLTDISAEGDNDILLKGEAVSYNNLVKYYQMLTADKDFFTGGAVLEKSDLRTNGNIAFSIKLKL